MSGRDVPVPVHEIFGERESYLRNLQIQITIRKRPMLNCGCTTSVMRL